MAWRKKNEQSPPIMAQQQPPQQMMQQMPQMPQQNISNSNKNNIWEAERVPTETAIVIKNKQTGELFSVEMALVRILNILEGSGA